MKLWGTSQTEGRSGNRLIGPWHFFFLSGNLSSSSLPLFHIGHRMTPHRLGPRYILYCSRIFWGKKNWASMKTLDKLLLSTSVWGACGSRGNYEVHPHIPTDVRCNVLVSTLHATHGTPTLPKGFPQVTIYNSFPL